MRTDTRDLITIWMKVILFLDVVERSKHQTLTFDLEDYRALLGELCVSRPLLLCPPEIELVHRGFAGVQDSLAGVNGRLRNEVICPSFLVS